MNSPAVPARASLLRSRARAGALYRLLSQAARSLMAREKQMPLSASLVFLSCSRFSPSITSPRWRALSPASAGCSFSNGTRKTNAAFSVACFSFVLIIYQNRLEREYRKRYDFQADPNMVLQFTRSFLGADFALAGKSAPRKLRRERHFMSKRSCEAAESIEDALLRMKWRGELLEYYAWISRTRQYCFREKCFSTTPYTLNPNC